MDKKRLFLIMLLISAVTLGVLLAITTNSEIFHPSPIQKRTQFAEHTITLTRDGFTPDEMHVKQGETVKFITTTDRAFWPASNLHPTHELYPAFDPKEPIPADKSFLFTFTELGSWKYHDHLAPYFSGIIVVEK